MPGVKAEEHVGAHQQPQFVVWIPGLQLRQGVGRVALALPVKLHIQSLHLVPQAQLFPGQAGHFQPLLRRGAAGRQGLVGRNAGGDQQQLVQLQHGKDRGGRRQVPQMWRVEGPAVNSDFQENSISCVFCAYACRFLAGFTSWMRFSLGLLWLSRYSTNLVPIT